jgi:hypothetical protein
MAVDSTLDRKTKAATVIGDLAASSKKLFAWKARDRAVTEDPWNKLLTDAEFLLDYACQAGIPLDPKIVATILSANSDERLTTEQTVEVIGAITALAAKLRPVTPASLRACRHLARSTAYWYWGTALAVGSFLLITSVTTFITTGLSQSLTLDIEEANQLAVPLNAKLADLTSPPSTAAGSAGAQAAPTPPPVVDSMDLTHLQEFAATTRAVYRVTLQLSGFVGGAGTRPRNTPDPNAVDIDNPRSLEIVIPVNFQNEVPRFTRIYQEVRYRAKDVQDRVRLYYGAVGNFLLPPLYGILGACAYLLKSFSDQLRARTFVPSITDTARFIMAGIGGGAVGLFSNFVLDQGISLSPLAIAFLVGYATDIFFSFLDNLQQAFTKAKPQPAPEVAAAPPTTIAPG